METQYKDEVWPIWRYYPSIRAAREKLTRARNNPDNSRIRPQQTSGRIVSKTLVFVPPVLTSLLGTPKIKRARNFIAWIPNVAVPFCWMPLRLAAVSSFALTCTDFPRFKFSLSPRYVFCKWHSTSVPQSLSSLTYSALRTIRCKSAAITVVIALRSLTPAVSILTWAFTFLKLPVITGSVSICSVLSLPGNFIWVHFKIMAVTTFRGLAHFPLPLSHLT